MSASLSIQINQHNNNLNEIYQKLIQVFIPLPERIVTHLAEAPDSINLLIDEDRFVVNSREDMLDIWHKFQAVDLRAEFGKLDEFEIQVLIDELKNPQDWLSSCKSQVKLTQNEIYEKYKNAVLAISINNSIEQSNGTGWIYKRLPRGQDGKYGYQVVTNYHMIQNDKHSTTNQFFLRDMQNNYLGQASLLAIDPLADIALIEFRTRKKLDMIPLEKYIPDLSHEVLYVFGNTNGEGLNLLNVQSDPSKKSINITNEFKEINEYPYPNVAYKGPTKPGNSGSPVFNQWGQMIAMQHAGSPETDYSFGIPTSVIQDSLLRLEKPTTSKLEPVYLNWGFNPRPETLVVNEQLMVRGMRVDKLIKGGAAQLSDLKIGDIITAINGNPVPFDLGKFLFYMLSTEGPQQISYYRPSTNETVKVTLNPQTISYSHPKTYETLFGISFATMTQSDYNRMNLEPESHYFKIVNSGSNHFAEIEVVTAINGQEFARFDDFLAKWQQLLATQSPITLTVFNPNPSREGLVEAQRNVLVYSGK